MNCSLHPEWDYEEFNQWLTQKAARQRIPIKGTLELTFRCNLRCQHCYVSHGHQGLPGQVELSISEIRLLIDQVVDAGCLWFLLTGGEPLLRKGFEEIYLYAKHKGLLLYLFTNGTLLTPRLADLLAEWRPYGVEITLYGYTQETYERVTGMPGSHTRCLKGIELLLARNVPLKLKTVLMTLNQHELHLMEGFARSLGVNFYYDGMLNAGLEGSRSPRELRLSPERIVQFDRADPARKSAWKEAFSKPVPPATSRLYKCQAGLNSFHVDPYGKLSLCMMDRRQQYNLRQGSFQDGWSFLSVAGSQECSPQNDCQTCSLRIVCTQCPGLAWMESGDPEERVEFLCDVAHLRAQAFRSSPVV